MDKVNIASKFALIVDHWHPRIVAEVNGLHVKLVKLKGEFAWHHHEIEDELFFVVKGRLHLHLPDRDLWVEEGEFMVVPHGVRHKPVAPEETHVLLLEPRSTLNTGDADDERTVANPEWI